MGLTIKLLSLDIDRSYMR